MTPEQRKRAGRAVADRINEMSATPSAIARAAGVTPKTVRALIRGERWPSEAVQTCLERALRWRDGDMVVHAVNGDGAAAVLAAASDVELAAELLRRATARHERDMMLRATDMPERRLPLLGN